MDAAQLAEVFTEWNRGELESYLIEITSQILRKIDPEPGKPLVDMILDKAGQKGTGIWTLQSAIKQSVVISTINAAVEARVISSRKDERVAASKILPQPRVRKFKGNRMRFIDAVRDALYASKIVSYTQGMELLRAASTGYNWNLNLSDIATIWRGGCIIRAKFLNRIVEAYQDRKSTRLNSSHSQISYAVFCLKKKNNKYYRDACHASQTCDYLERLRRPLACDVLASRPILIHYLRGGDYLYSVCPCGFQLTLR